MYYKIADCFVKYEPNYMYMQKKIKPYEERFHGESENSCIYLGYKSDAYYKKKQKMHPEITCEKLEYVYVGAEFNRKILKYGGIMIHSSAVEVDGKAYFFLLHVVQENRHIRSSGKNILVQIRRL
jgi:hypothetical protein